MQNIGLDPKTGLPLTGNTSQFVDNNPSGPASLAGTINSSSLAPVSPYYLPAQTPNTTAAGVIATVSPDVLHPTDQAQKTVNDLFGGVDQIQNQKNNALSNVQGLLGQEANLQTAQQTSPEEQQLSTERTNLANINTEIANQQVAYRAEQDKIKARGDISQGAQNGLNQNLDDVYGTRLANLAIRQSAATGNITALTAASDRALQMKLAPIQTQISYYTDFLSKNLDSLSDTEKQKVTAIIAEKKNEADQVQADQTTANTALKTALENGVKVPDSVVQQVQKNPSQAYQILASNGISLQNPFDIAYKQAQIASLNATAASKSASGASGGGVSQELQDAINNGTIDPNKINSRTLGIYNDIAKAGVDAVGSHAGAAGETKAITDLSSYKSTATRTLAVLESNLPLVENLADKVNTVGIPLLDAYVTGKKAVLTNNPDVVKYVNSLKTLRAEYAQMLAKGNAATESDKDEAAQAIPSGLSSAAYSALGDQLKLEAQNILAASDAAIQSAKSKSASNNANSPTSQFDNLFSQYGGQ